MACQRIIDDLLLKIDLLVDMTACNELPKRCVAKWNYEFG
jgi:hypothetical protein